MTLRFGVKRILSGRKCANGTGKLTVYGMFIIIASMFFTLSFPGAGFGIAPGNTGGDGKIGGLLPVQPVKGKVKKDIEKMQRVDIPFVANDGQISDESVKFYTRTFGGTVFVTDRGEIIYSLLSFGKKKKLFNDKMEKLLQKNDLEKMSQSNIKKGWSLKEILVGSLGADPRGDGRVQTKISYFKGVDRSRWKSNVAAYSRVDLGEIYPGIELTLKARGNNVEKVYTVKPHTDLDNIRVRVEGALSLKVEEKGELGVETGLGMVRFTAPVAYQEKDGKNEYVRVAYHLDGDTYGFTVEDYDRSRPLIIDPMLASTFIGGSDEDETYSSLVMDGEGNIYLSGFAVSPDFPTTTGSYDMSDGDVFVLKLDSSLSTLLAIAFIGGYHNDCPASLAINGAGDIYVGGSTRSTNFPTTTGAYDTSHNGVSDFFIAKFDSGLGVLMASTYIGGKSDEDFYFSLVLDSSSNVYMAGGTLSSDYPTTAGAYNNFFNNGEVVVSKLDPGLSVLLASTFIGGSSGEIAASLALDGAGNVYVAGRTGSADYPVTLGAYNKLYKGDGDVFISKLDPSLGTLLASSFIGGSSIEFTTTLALDGAGNIYVVGWTMSTDYPNTNGTSLKGPNDAFISKFDPSLNALLASTLIGGTGYEYAYSLALNKEGNIYVGGWTTSSDYPTTVGAYNTTYKGGYSDVFVSKLEPDLGILLNSTYIGGAGGDYLESNALAIDSAGNIYFAGNTRSADYPTTPEAYDTTFNGIYDVFITRFSGDLSLTHSLSGSGAVVNIATLNQDSREESYISDPVDAATGAHVIRRSLLGVSGAIPIDFRVSYNSLLLKEGPLGRGWGHDHQARLEFPLKGSINVRWTANRVNHFTAGVGNLYTSTELDTCHDSLVKNADGSYTLTRRDQTLYIFNQTGQLIEKRNGHGQSLIMTYDGSGWLVRVTDALSGRFLAFHYNTSGLMESVTDSMNRRVIFTYDASHNLTGMAGPNGQITTYTYNGDGRVLTATDAEGRQLFSNTYDSFGRVEFQDDAVVTNQLTRFNYDETTQPGKVITTVTDRNGQTRILTHDGRYQLISVRDELGKSTTYNYDADGNRTSVTDAALRRTTFTYDSGGNLSSVTDPAGNVTNMTHDERNNLLTVENSAGKRITYTYDANNNPLSITDPLGNTTGFTYDANGLLTSKTTPGSGTTTYLYQNGLLRTATGPEGNITTFGYDGAGRVTGVTDGAGNTVTMTYDSAGNILTVADPLGNTKRFTYDSHGNMLTETDPLGNVTRYEYNGNGKLVSRTDPLNNRTAYEYDGEDRLAGITDARGSNSNLNYDARGRVVRAIDPLENTTNYRYDPVDNLVGKDDALGNQILKISYDSLNNPLTVTDALGRTATSQYDILNRLAAVTDPLGRVTRYNYDDMNRLISVADPMGGQAGQGFDPDGNPISLTDPNNNRTVFTFDRAGRITARTSASGSTVKYGYNAQNLLAQLTNGRGQTANLRYDAAGRLISLTDSAGTISYTYDANSNVLTVTDPGGTITRQYDALNRVKKYTDAGGNIIQYDYDPVGNLMVLTYPGGKQVRYDYDAVNRLIKVTDWAGRVTSYEYDPNGRLTKTTRPNGTVQTIIYDTAGQMLQQKDIDGKGNIIVQYDYTYDGAGNVTAEQSSAPMQPFNLPGAAMTYTADNRLATYNGQPVEYDADGNITKGPLGGAMGNYTFDCRNRLTSAGTTAYRYDAENNRTGIFENGKQTNYLINPHAPLSQVLIKTDEKDNQTFYVYGLGLIGQEEAGGVYRSYHYDRRGSTVALTDESGNITDRYQYSPYGTLTHRVGERITPFLYNGKYGVMTDGNGLYHMRARYYNPEIRRFINQDVVLGSIVNSQSLNRNVYAKNNPVLYIDPDGNFPLLISMAVGAAVGAVVSGTTAIVTEYLTTGKVDWENVGIATAAGAASGALAGSGVGLVGAIAGNAAISGGSYVATKLVHDEEPTVEGVLGSTVLGGIAGRIGGPGAFTKVQPYLDTIRRSEILGLESGVMFNKMQLAETGQNLVISNIFRTFAGNLVTNSPSFYNSEAEAYAGNK